LSEQFRLELSLGLSLRVEDFLSGVLWLFLRLSSLDQLNS